MANKAEVCLTCGGAVRVPHDQDGKSQSCARRNPGGTDKLSPIEVNKIRKVTSDSESQRSLLQPLQAAG